MPVMPTFQDIYDECRSEIEGDSVYQFLDWSPGSWGDTFTMLASVGAQTVLRYLNAKFLTAFVSTAKGSDLDYLALDRYGLVRQPGETDEEFRLRIQQHIDNLSRATVSALLAFALADVEVVGATVTEDLASGIVTITVTFDDGVVSADALARLRTDVLYWRAAGVTVAIVEA